VTRFCAVLSVLNACAWRPCCQQDACVVSAVPVCRQGVLWSALTGPLLLACHLLHCVGKMCTLHHTSLVAVVVSHLMHAIWQLSCVTASQEQQQMKRHVSTSSSSWGDHSVDSFTAQKSPGGHSVTSYLLCCPQTLRSTSLGARRTAFCSA
jgi:hypothetical protein